MSTSASLPQALRLAVLDVLVLTAVYFIPALAHLSQYKLYYLDPMRVLLLAAFLLGRDHRNTFFLAITIPLVSTIITGHPPFFKAILISVELLLNIWCFLYLRHKSRLHPGLLMFIAMVASKLVYYLLKYLFISVGLIGPGLITTGLEIQLVTVTVLAIVFSLFYRGSSRR